MPSVASPQSDKLRQPYTGGKLNSDKKPVVTTQPAIRADTTRKP